MQQKDKKKRLKNYMKIQCGIGVLIDRWIYTYIDTYYRQIAVKKTLGLEHEKFCIDEKCSGS